MANKKTSGEILGELAGYYLIGKGANYVAGKAGIGEPLKKNPYTEKYNMIDGLPKGRNVTARGRSNKDEK